MADGPLRTVGKLECRPHSGLSRHEKTPCHVGSPGQQAPNVTTGYALRRLGIAATRLLCHSHKRHSADMLCAIVSSIDSGTQVRALWRPFPSKDYEGLTIMKKCLAIATLAALSIHGITSAHADTVTVTFDDLSNFQAGGMPAVYAGLNWGCPSGGGGSGNQCMVLVNVPTYGVPSGYAGAEVSAPNVLSAQTFSFGPAAGGTFSIDSAYITGAWRDDQSVAIIGYNGSSVVDSTTLTLGVAGTQSLLTVDWNNLTSVSITATGGTASPVYTYTSINAIGVDNLTYSTSPVPLPAAAWLMLSGLGGLGAMLRKRRAA